MKITKLIPQGICKGVARAIKMVNEELNNPDINKPIYMLGSLVHNKNIMKSFIEKGVILIDTPDKLTALEKINEGTVIFTAHGISKQILKKAKEKGLKVIDTTCKDVTKIHNLIKDYLAEDYEIIFLGVENHPESIAIRNDYPVHFITEFTKIENLPEIKGNLILTNQSTMSYNKVKTIYNSLLTKYPNLILSAEVCPATRLRQDALLNADEDTDLIIVVGDKLSNNTKMLETLGKAKSSKTTILLETVEDINNYDLSNYKNCVITSGASTPFAIVKEIIAALKTYDKNIEYKSNLQTNDFLKLKGWLSSSFFIVLILLVNLFLDH